MTILEGTPRRPGANFLDSGVAVGSLNHCDVSRCGRVCAGARVSGVWMAITASKQNADLYPDDAIPFWFKLPPTFDNFSLLSIRHSSCAGRLTLPRLQRWWF